jgi:nucleotide-binding universal stress UspA family protein
MYRTVLIPTDGSPGANRAIEHGVDLASTYGATVHALYVVDEDVFEHYAGIDAIDHSEEALEHHGEDVLANVTDEVARVDPDVDVVTAIERGRAADAIVRYADANDVDVVVMGTERHSGEYRRLLGSVTENVARHATCPVHVVKTPGQDAPVDA